MQEKTLGVNDFIKLIEVCGMLISLVDKLYILLTRYVTFEELEKAGINDEIGRAEMLSKSFGLGGGSDDK